MIIIKDFKMRLSTVGEGRKTYRQYVLLYYKKESNDISLKNNNLGLFLVFGD